MIENTLRELDALVRTHTNRHVAECKAQARPVVGYFCHYVPAEIILAAGAMPLRLRGAGSEDSSEGDAFMSSRVCTFVRHVVSLAMDGQFDFLDGAVCANTCDHVRRAADLFIKKTEIPFNGFLSVPRNPRESLFPYYLQELKKLIAGMEESFGTKASDDALRQAIRAMNANRARLHEINRLRLEDTPRLTGAEALTVHIAWQTLPQDVFADLADRLLQELPQRAMEKPRVRLVMAGAEMDEPAYMRAIESQGAVVVADLLCFGARSVLEDIDADAPDPLEAVARAYFFQPSCARMIGDFPARWELLKSTVREARAQGVVFQRLMFCDPWGAEIHNIMHRAQQDKAFPVLSLSREYGIVPTGQIRTRVQAFMEQIEIAGAQAAAGGGA